MKYYYHLWAIAPKYQLLQISESALLYVSYRILHGECSEVLSNMIHLIDISLSADLAKFIYTIWKYRAHSQSVFMVLFFYSVLE